MIITDKFVFSSVAMGERYSDLANVGELRQRSRYEEAL